MQERIDRLRNKLISHYSTFVALIPGTTSIDPDVQRIKELKMRIAYIKKKIGYNDTTVKEDKPKPVKISLADKLKSIR